MVSNTKDKIYINQKVIELIAEVLSVDTEELSPTMELSESLGADSMDIVTIAAGLSEEFSIDIDLSDIPAQGVTVSWITSEVVNMLEAKESKR